MTDLDDIKQRVKETTNLAHFIEADGVPLSGGPTEWKGLCPFHPDKNPSFTVNSEKGFFHCFGCGNNGDVFEFVMRRKGLDFMNALKLVAARVGTSIPDKRVWQPREVKEAAEPVRGPFDPEKYAALDPKGAVFAYLTGKRLLKPELLERYSVGQTADGLAYCFAYKWWAPGQVRREGGKPRFEFAKVVALRRDEAGKKIEWRDPKGGKNILFGMTAIPDDARELVIAEGELDAITWAQYGWPAVSVPGGAGYTGWIQLCYDWLQRFKKIRISFDEDRAGRAKVVEVVNRLGMARTDIIRLPEKEAA